MACNNYTAADSCPECGSVLRYIEKGRVKCNNCGMETDEAKADLEHGGRACVC